MAPTKNQQSECTTAGESASEQALKEAQLVPEEQGNGDTSSPDDTGGSSVPSAAGSGSVWLRCRVRQGSLGSCESSTQA